MSVLVVVTHAEDAAPLVRWGARFARARETTLEVLHVTRGTQAAEPEEMAEDDPTDTHPVRSAIRSALKGELVGRLTQRFELRKTAHLRRLLLESEGEHEDADSAGAEGAGAPKGEPATSKPPRRPEPAPPPAPSGGASSTAPPPLPVTRTGRVDENLAALQDEGFARFRTVAHVDPVEAALEALRRVRADLLLVGRTSEAGGGEAVALGRTLLQVAPCDTVLLRAQGESGKHSDKVLIPAAGGPHSTVALRLGRGLIDTDQGEVVPLYVAPDGGDEAEMREVGARQLSKVLLQAGLSGAEDQVTPQVTLARTPVSGISAAVRATPYDLVLVGASQEGFVRRMLFGVVPDKLLAGPQGTAVAVVRAARPLAERAIELVDRVVSRWLPQLDRVDRVALFERLQEGSQFGFDFAALIAASTGIASLGLIQNSAAVVIGAMLVAPLMTPMIGAGLALIQGNTMLVADAARAIAKGIVLAVTIGAVMGLLGRVTGILPQGELTPQLLARGAPTVLDLVIAYLSGLAAAYALARPNLSGALPGVAIAAALVPPLGTVGIALSHEVWPVASGAALLFGTNLVAIILGAATVFRGIGVHANRNTAAANVWVRRAVGGLVLAALGLASWFMVHLPALVAGEGQTIQVTDGLHSALQRAVEADRGHRIVFVAPRRGAAELEVVIAAERESDEPGLQARLAAAAEAAVSRPVRVRLVVLEATRVLEPPE